jgi:phosphatidylglycerophosphate synthase
MAGRRAIVQELRLQDALRLPGLISLVRVILAVVFPFVASRPVLAVGVVLLAGASDVLDGWAARRRREETAMGALLDATADKVFVGTVLVTLLFRQALGLIDLLLLSTREIIEAVAVAQGLARGAPVDRERRANPAGKIATVLQFVTFLVVLVGLSPTAPILGAAAAGTIAGLTYAARERGGRARQRQPPSRAVPGEPSSRRPPGAGTEPSSR